MDFVYWCKAKYFDASALVKLVADDPSEEQGREALRKYYWGNVSSLYATPCCVVETFSVFKRKFARNEITEEQYLKYVQTFIRQFLGANLRQDQVPVLSPIVFSETERLVKTYKLDFVDCLQIVTIMRGQFGVLGPNSQSILITADDGLAVAARSEGARVWHCRTEPPPN
ncbi:MAG: hypothetical protein NVS9B4_22780 [Candidatus Acidiferrum sp.]